MVPVLDTFLIREYIRGGRQYLIFTDRKDRSMKLAEKLLLFLSREPERADNVGAADNVDNALFLLCSVYPNFMDMIKEKEVVDFGSGWGLQSIALARSGAKHVLGLEIHPRGVENGIKLAATFCVEQKVNFTHRIEESHKGKFDVVISQNSMEHFNDPVAMVVQMKSLLKPKGTLLITFGPPWFAPYGSHMDFFIKLPWVNILFSEKTVMNVRSHFRHDGATRYEDIESGLNKMTVAKFERIISASGLHNCLPEI